jgi:hypothetical protein
MATDANAIPFAYWTAHCTAVRQLIFASFHTLCDLVVAVGVVT